MSFEDRMLTQEITGMWIDQATELSREAAIERIEEATREFERTYNAVATVEVGEIHTGERTIKIRAIMAQDANMDEIQRGLQVIQASVYDD